MRIRLVAGITISRIAVKLFPQFFSRAIPRLAPGRKIVVGECKSGEAGALSRWFLAQILVQYCGSGTIYDRARVATLENASDLRTSVLAQKLSHGPARLSPVAGC
jgi:hypothetical protein